MSDGFKNLIETSGIADCFPLNLSTFNQCQVEDIFQLISSKPDIQYVISIKSNIKVHKTRILPTPLSKSFDGSIMTGLKLLVPGEVETVIEYITDNPEQPVYNATFSKPFTSYIILDDNFHQDSDYIVIPYIEDSLF